MRDGPVLPLSAVTVVETPLSETWLSAASLDGVTCSTALPTSPRWTCAVNAEHRVLFTQMISSTGQMRDGYYEYLLLVGRRVVIVAYDGTARILPVGAWRAYPYDEIVGFVNRCAVLVCCDHAGFAWSGPPAL